MAKKTFVIDTSVFLSDYNSIYNFQNNDIVIPLKVLEEIDKHKKRQDAVGLNARNFIRVLDSLREKGSLKKGIRIDKGRGIVKVFSHEEIDENSLPPDLTIDIPDHMIIATALTVKANSPKTRKVILVSRDINLRVISNAVGVESEDYVVSQVIDDADKIYSGLATILVDDEMIDRFYDGEDIRLTEEMAIQQQASLYANCYIMLLSSSNQKKSCLSRFKSYHEPLKRVVDYKKSLKWGVFPRNKEQTFAFDLLMNPDIPLVTLIGQAGSGKTLCAIAAGMEQSLYMGTTLSDQMKDMGLIETNYKKLVVSRPVQPLGRDIGFLPGSMEEKMMPWLKPIQDNMQFIMGNDRIFLQDMMEKGTVELEALTYIRGRSISNAFIVIDEAQNLTAHEVKTIITRVGEGTKIVLTGDIEQIDNVYTNETSNGLTYAIEKFKHSPLSGHITFTKGERSRLATEAAKIL